MFPGTLRLPAVCQPRPIHENNGVSLARNMASDLVEMHLHCLGVGPWQHKSSAYTMGRAYSAEQICIFVSLVNRHAGTSTFLCPYACLSVLLAQPRFILPPDFNWSIFRQIGYVCCKRFGEVFLKASITRSSYFGCCGRVLMQEKPRTARSSVIERSL